MSTAAIAVLERAVALDDIDSIKAAIAQALGSLRQRPGVYHDLQVHARLEKAVARFDSAAQAAAAWDVPKQTLHSARNGDIPYPPKVLRAIGLRRLPPGRTLYEEV